jgi:hypothetical protein
MNLLSGSGAAAQHSKRGTDGPAVAMLHFTWLEEGECSVASKIFGSDAAAAAAGAAVSQQQQQPA